jgi:hypothetical protein
VPRGAKTPAARARHTPAPASSLMRRRDLPDAAGVR